jgi:hypothetical protein
MERKFDPKLGGHVTSMTEEEMTAANLRELFGGLKNQRWLKANGYWPLIEDSRQHKR